MAVLFSKTKGKRFEAVPIEPSNSHSVVYFVCPGRPSYPSLDKRSVPQRDRKTDRQAGRQTDSRIGERIDGQTDRQTD